MRIGLADASAPAQAGDCGREVAWGYVPYSGEVCAYSDPVVAGGSASVVERGLNPRVAGPPGTTVRVTADMGKRRMLVSVNGGAAVDAGVELPETVRLWCSLYCKGDAVQLESVSSSGGAGAAPPSDLKRRLTAAEVDAMKVRPRREAARVLPGLV